MTDQKTCPTCNQSFSPTAQTKYLKKLVPHPSHKTTCIDCLVTQWSTEKTSMRSELIFLKQLRDDLQKQYHTAQLNWRNLAEKAQYLDYQINMVLHAKRPLQPKKIKSKDTDKNLKQSQAKTTDKKKLAMQIMKSLSAEQQALILAKLSAGNPINLA